MDSPLTETAAFAPWLIDALPWAVAALLLLAFAGALAAWMAVAHLRNWERLDRRLEALDELRSLLRKLASERDDIDLRRLEHVVIDIRDAQKRTEDVLLRAVEHASAERAGANGRARAAETTLSERAVNRLLALGYERVHVVSSLDEVGRVAGGDGEILVEAHRQGVLHKGRVLVRAGALSDVELSAAYSIFP